MPGLLDPEFWRFNGVTTGLLGPQPPQPSGSLSPGSFDPGLPGWHSYIQGPDLICPASFACTPEEIADQNARYAVPGRNPATPVINGKTYDVYAAPGLDVGQVTTQISNGGQTITNRTLPHHIFYDGQVMRTAVQGPDGAWYMITSGDGNNVFPGVNKFNQAVGPDVFRNLDQQMRANIERRHVTQ